LDTGNPVNWLKANQAVAGTAITVKR